MEKSQILKVALIEVYRFLNRGADLEFEKIFQLNDEKKIIYLKFYIDIFEKILERQSQI